MDKSPELTDYERIVALEAKVAEQEGQIEALLDAVGALMVAQAASHNDARVPRYLAECRNYSGEKAREGGTTHIEPSWFEARANGYWRILASMSDSAGDLLYRYARPRIRYWKEFKRFDRMKEKLQKIANEE